MRPKLLVLSILTFGCAGLHRHPPSSRPSSAETWVAQRLDSSAAPSIEGALPLRLVAQLGHSRDVNELIPHADGEHLISQAPDGLVVWGIDSGREVRRFEGLSRDDQLEAGSLLLSSQTAATILDPRTNLELGSIGLDPGDRAYLLPGARHLMLEQGPCRSVLSVPTPAAPGLLDPDPVWLWCPEGGVQRVVVHGGVLAILSTDGRARIVHLDSGRESRLPGSSVRTLDLSEDGSTAVWHGWDGTLGVWTVDTNVARAVQLNGRHPEVEVSADGSVATLHFGELVLKVCETESLRCVAALPATERVVASDGGSKPVALGGWALATMIDFDGDGNSHTALTIPNGVLRSRAFQEGVLRRDDQLLVEVQGSPSFLHWDLGQSTEAMVPSWSGLAPEDIAWWSFHPDGTSILIVDELGLVFRYELATRQGTLVSTTGPTTERSTHTTTALSPDGTTLWLSPRNGEIWQVDLNTGQSRAFDRPARQLLASVQADPWLVAPTADGIQRWDLRDASVATMTMANARVPPNRGLGPGTIAVSREGLVATTHGWSVDDHGGYGVLWNPDTLQILPLEGQTIRLHGLGFSPSGDLLLSSDVMGTRRLWRWSGKTIEHLDWLGKPREAAFLPSGAILSLDDSGTVRRWDPTTGQGTVFSGPEVPYASMALRTDGTYLATWGRKGLVVWDVDKRSGSKLKGAPRFSREAVFTHDGRLLVHSLDDRLLSYDLSRPGRSPQLLARRVQSFSLAGRSPRVALVTRSRSGTTLSHVIDLDSGQPLVTRQELNPSTTKQLSPGGGVMLDTSGPGPEATLTLIGQDRELTLSDTRVETVEFDATGAFLTRRLGGASWWDPSLGSGWRLPPGLDHHISEDGRFVSIVKGSGRIDLWSTERHVLICSLYNFSNGTRVVLDPESRFQASGQVSGLHWVVDLPEGPEIIDFDQLRGAYGDLALYAKLTDTPPRDPIKLSPFDHSKLPPLVDTELIASEGRMSLRATITARGAAVSTLEVWQDGIELLGFHLDEALPDSVEILSEPPLRVQVSLDQVGTWNPRGGKAELRAINMAGVGSRNTGLPELQDGDEGPATHFNVHALLVGVSSYDDAKLKLSYADDDAVALHRALDAGAKAYVAPWNGEVHIHRLDTSPSAAAAPTKANIMAALEDLATSTTFDDVVVLFFAGHGKTVESGTDAPGQYYFLASEMHKGDIFEPDLRALRAISGSELATMLRAIPARKKLLVLDTCGAAGALPEEISPEDGRTEKEDTQETLEDLRRRFGLYVLAASAADKQAYEPRMFRHGLLTWALLDGMRGNANLPGSGEWDVRSLVNHATTMVPRLSFAALGHRQTAIERVPDGGVGFPLGRVPPDVEQFIDLREFGEVVLSPLFHDGFEDRLDLIGRTTKALALHADRDKSILRAVSQTWQQDAWKLVGTYRIGDDGLELLVTVQRDGRAQACMTLEAPDTSDASLDYLATRLVAQLDRVVADLGTGDQVALPEDATCTAPVVTTTPLLQALLPSSSGRGGSRRDRTN